MGVSVDLAIGPQIMLAGGAEVTYGFQWGRMDWMHYVHIEAVPFSVGTPPPSSGASVVIAAQWVETDGSGALTRMVTFKNQLSTPAHVYTHLIQAPAKW